MCINTTQLFLPNTDTEKVREKKSEERGLIFLSEPVLSHSLLLFSLLSFAKHFSELFDDFIHDVLHLDKPLCFTIKVRCLFFFCYRFRRKAAPS